MDSAESIEAKLIEKMGDLDAAKQRWIVVMVLSMLLFGFSLGVFFLPVSELSTQDTIRFEEVDKESYASSGEISTVAIPNTYFMKVEAKLESDWNMPNSQAYVYLFKDEVPEINLDIEDLRSYLREKSYVSDKLAYREGEDVKVTWEMSLRNCSTTTYYLLVYNPDNPDTPYDDNVPVTIEAQYSYEPLLPLIPLTFLIMFIIIPIGIIRIYVLSQKKKEIRIQMSLDLKNLSDEDKVRLGIPVDNK
jgi:hypothetical protein